MCSHLSKTIDETDILLMHFEDSRFTKGEVRIRNWGYCNLAVWMSSANYQIIDILAIFSSVKNISKFGFSAHDFYDIVEHSLVFFSDIL